MTPTPSPRVPSLRRRVAILLIALSATLILTEIGLRIYASASHQERGLVYDPDLGWRMAPSLVKVGTYWGRDVPAQTNSLGWRDAEFGTKAEGVTRIAALGDSYVFGVGVDDGERFTELLENDSVDVLNLGVNAYGTDQELRLLETVALDLDPDVVLLVVFLGNDLEDISYERRFGWQRPHYELEAGALRLVPPELSWAVWLRTSSYFGELAMRPLEGWLNPPRQAPSWQTGDVVRLFSALVQHMASLLESEGTRFLVAIAYPGEWLVGGVPEREARARDRLLESSIEVLDLWQPLMNGGAELFLADGHWTPRGHTAVAKALWNKLTELGWLP